MTDIDWTNPMIVAPLSAAAAMVALLAAPRLWAAVRGLWRSVGAMWQRVGAAAQADISAMVGPLQQDVSALKARIEAVEAAIAMPVPAPVPARNVVPAAGGLSPVPPALGN